MTASTTPSSSSTGNCWSLLLFLTSCFASVFLSRFKILSWWFVFTGDATKIDFQSLLSLADEGIDVSFLKPRGKKRLNTHLSYYKCHFTDLRGAVAQWLVRWTPERAVRDRALFGVVVLVQGPKRES